MRGILGRLGLIGFGCSFGLLVAELLLQLGSLWTWWRAGDPAPAERDGSVRVLCIGDSFTYGVGAGREGSYPSQLQELLDERPDGSRWTVINAGFPGRNSAELLQRLPPLLREHQPDDVCVLIGTNDQWSRAEWDAPIPELDSGGTEQGWQLRFRLARLFHVVRPELERRWRWYTRDREENPGRSEAAAAARARLSELQRRAEQGEDLLEIRDELDALEPIVLRERDDESLDVLFGLLARCCSSEEVIARLERGWDTVGPRSNLACVMARAQSDAGHHDAARDWVDRARAAAEIDIERSNAEEAAFLVHLRRKEWPDCLAAVGALLAVDDDFGRAQVLVRRIAMREEGARSLQASLTRGELERSPMRRLVEDALDALGGSSEGIDEEAPDPTPELDTELARELVENLKAVSAMIRESGATPLLLSYPRPRADREVDRLLAWVGSEEADAVFVDFGPSFRQLFQEDGRERYLARDGHCNDAGYRVMAEILAERLRELHPRTNR